MCEQTTTRVFVGFCQRSWIYETETTANENWIWIWIWIVWLRRNKPPDILVSLWPLNVDWKTYLDWELRWLRKHNTIRVCLYLYMAFVCFVILSSVFFSLSTPFFMPLPLSLSLTLCVFVWVCFFFFFCSFFYSLWSFII